MLVRLISLFLLVGMLAVSGWAEIYSPTLVKKAEEGDAEAQFCLGTCYLYGHGVTKDKIEATKWYKRAAEQGDEAAKKALKTLQPLEEVNAATSTHTRSFEQASNISKLVFLVRSEKSTGTCFLMKDKTNNYIYSNLHVFYGSTNSVIKNAELKSMPIPDYIEVAHGYDLIRFRSTDPDGDGFQMGDLPKIDDEIDAYGNSQGTGVITKNSGKVLGLGDSSIEVSCGIVPGNSGGPIIDKDGKVIGIASFLNKRDEDKWNEETRYDKVRRFGIRVDQPIKWESVKYSEFKKDAVFLEALEDSLDTIVTCVLSIDNTKMMMPCALPKTLPSPLKAQNKLDNVVRYHNKNYCDDYSKMKGKDMINYMYTQLKEACDLVVEDNRPSLNSEWAKNLLDDIKSRKERISVLMIKRRDDVNKMY